jgi:paraquat-inducible protein B
LRAKKLGSLSVGAPVYFRQFDVGEITEYALAEDHTHVDIGIFVEAPHDQYIREGTRFWNAGGVNLSLTSSGVNLEMESLVALISGGIAYETLPEYASTPVAQENTVFNLYDNHTESLERPITIAFTFVTRFGGSVRGLNVGAPVEFRGIRVGTVKAIELGRGVAEQDITVPVVLIDIEPQRIRRMMNINHMEDNQQQQHDDFERDTVKRIEYQVLHKGLRARLQTGNLVTGQLFVDLDYFPDAEPVTLTRMGDYPEIPTLPNPLEGILIGFNKIIDKLEQADLEETLANLNQLLVSSNELMSTLGRNAPELAAELQATLENARTTLGSLGEVASPEGEIGVELYNALAEFTAAARSIRIMAEYLERHPEALLKGKSGNP